MAIKIQRGVPIPPGRKCTGIMVAIKAMKVGDSFIYHNAKSARSVANFAKIKICIREEGDGFRIWRTA